ncbi:S-layer homology domain-containing protein [Neomoorella thermoacetica]|nr:S-layer homology domain-containing protein [Moorella thermoacetica]
MAIALLAFILAPGLAWADDEEDKSYNEQVLDDLMYYKYSFEQGNLDTSALIDHLHEALNKLNKSDIQEGMREDIRQVVKLIAANMADLPANSVPVKATKTKLVITLGSKTLPDHFHNIIYKAEDLTGELTEIGLSDMVELLHNSMPRDVIGLKVPEDASRGSVQLSLSPISVDDFEGLEEYSLLVKDGGITFKIPLRILRSKDGGSSLTLSYKTVEPAPLFLPAADALKSAEYDIDIFWQKQDGSRDDKQTGQVVLTMPYRQDDSTDPDYLGVFTYNDTARDWTIVKGEFKASDQVDIPLTGPGKYAVLEYKKTFADIAGHWAEKDIVYMASKQIAQGLMENYFLPDNPVTRAQFAAMVLKTFGQSEVIPEKPTFIDVPSESEYFGAVEGAYRAGLIAGVDKTHFAPGLNITREEMAAMIARGLGSGVLASADQAGALEKLKNFKDYDNLSPWARQSMALCYQLGIIKGMPDQTIQPKANTSRAEATVMLRRVLDLLTAKETLPK